MRKKFFTIIVAGFITLLPFNSNAWGVLGHRIVGEIADSYLTSKARKEIVRILGNESLAMCSNWGDFIKSDPAFKYLYNWHFINLDGGLSKEQVMAHLESDTTTNAYTKINFMVGELKKKDLPKDMQVMYLKMLVHVVGDIHQPMHVGRVQDLGGNKVKVLWFRDSVNLHQVWDERLIEFQQLSYTEYARAINYTTKEQRKTWYNEPLSSWIYQSYQYAERIYSDIKNPAQKLDYRYNFDYVEILNQQLLKGGVHLAGLLNEIFR